MSSSCFDMTSDKGGGHHGHHVCVRSVLGSLLYIPSDDILTTSTTAEVDDDGDDDDYGNGRRQRWRRRDGRHVDGDDTMATARRVKKLNCFTVEKINCHLLQLIVPFILLVKLSLTRTIRVTIKYFINCTRNNI